MNDKQIAERLANRMPKNTRNSKESIWRQFQRFLEDENLLFDENTSTDEEINELLKKFAFNMRTIGGEDYKDESLKSVWNSVAKTIMDLVFKATRRKMNIFSDQAFQEARDAKFLKRQDLQKDPTKRKVSATPLTSEECRQMIEFWGIDSPNGMNRTLFHLGGFALANRGNDQSSWRIEDFVKEVDNKGQPTGFLFLMNFILFYFIDFMAQEP
jgi:hypothetical protein